MNDELNLDAIEGEAEEKLKVKNRFEKLSEKVIITSKEKEAEIEARKKAEGERDAISKERDFYKEFSANVSKHPNASEYQDKILEKVKSGYSTEDAMVSVLAKEGKLSSTSQEQNSRVQVEGGSAVNIQGGTKSIKDMTMAEKLSALQDADKSGDLVQALRG